MYIYRMKGIYKIVNKLNDKFYLGSTSNFHKRKLRHFNELRKNKHHSIYLQRAFNKYGEENFEFIEIEICENIKEREQEILNSLDYKLCYNVSKSASGGDLISNHPNVLEIKNNARINLSKAPKRGPVDGDKNPNWKGGISKVNCTSCGSEINFGALKCSNCYFSERDISGSKNPFYNKSHSKETKEIMRNSKLGKYNGNQEKAVIVDGIKYKSLSATSKKFGVVPATILNRIKSENYPNYNYE
jgi:group I intron endonuclease